MQISYRVHAQGAGLKGLAKQSAFAMANAINRTLDEGQAAQRSLIHSRFTLRGRSAGFVDRMVKRRREDFARRDRVVGRLRIEGPENDLGRGAILGRHEQGGVQSTGKGGASVDPQFRMAGYFYLPDRSIRPSFSASVPRRFYPANLRLVERRAVDGFYAAGVHTTKSRGRMGAGGVMQLKGKDRTFVLFSANCGSGGVPIGIFQRNAGKRGRATDRRWGQRDPNIKRLWSFQRQVTLKPRLAFHETQERNVATQFAVNYRGMLSHALRTAR